MERTTAYLMNDEGIALVELAVRESTTAPARLKVAFTLDITNGLRVTDGEHEAPLDGAPIGAKVVIDREFRLEMN